MSAGHVVEQQSTPAIVPPRERSNEAGPGQLATAEQQGDAYGAALQSMAEEDGAAVTRAGHYLVALVTEQAEGVYAPDDSGRLVWREAPEEPTRTSRSPSPTERMAASCPDSTCG
ncbi:hypothetical protein [Geodermatophilus sp. SYSU D00696]